MKQTISGKELQKIMILNRKSLTGSAKILGISVDELNSYFEYDEFEISFIENIRDKLGLLTIIDVEALTPAALDILEKKDSLIKSQQALIEARGKQVIEKDAQLIVQLDKILRLYVIIDKHLPKIFRAEEMEENYQLIKEILVEMRGHSF